MEVLTHNVIPAALRRSILVLATAEGLRLPEVE